MLLGEEEKQEDILVETDCIVLNIVDTNLGVVEKINDYNVGSLIKTYTGLIKGSPEDDHCQSLKGVITHLFKTTVDLYSNLGAETCSVYS